jgi:methyl-accepting chemotaxis protein
MNKKFRVIAAAILVFSAIIFLSGLNGCAAGKSAQSQAVTMDILIKGEVETAVSMLQGIADRAQSGEMTMDQAKTLGASLLRVMVYGKDGYFWADTEEGVNVVLYGRSDVEGRNRLEDKDIKGKYYIKEFISSAKAGGGYVDYFFTKKGETKDLPKRSYVMLFKPFGWVVGTGYYK